MTLTGCNEAEREHKDGTHWKKKKTMWEKDDTLPRARQWESAKMIPISLCPQRVFCRLRYVC